MIPTVITCTYDSVSRDKFVKSAFQVTPSQLPERLSIELTVRPDIRKTASYIIKGQKVNGELNFFSGLAPTCLSGWYYGDHCQSHTYGKSQSLFVVDLTSPSKMTVHYFESYYITERTERQDVVCDIVEQLEQSKAG